MAVVQYTFTHKQYIEQHNSIHRITQFREGSEHARNVIIILTFLTFSPFKSAEISALTLRLLMSYIYIYMEHQFLMFLDHTQRRTTVGRTPLDE